MLSLVGGAYRPSGIDHVSFRIRWVQRLGKRRFGGIQACETLHSLLNESSQASNERSWLAGLLWNSTRQVEPAELGQHRAVNSVVLP